MSKQGPFFPTPEGDVSAYTPDGTMRAQQDGRVLSNVIDGGYLHGGVGACADGGEFGYTNYGGGYGDTTGASPRRPPDYGLAIITKG